MSLTKVLLDGRLTVIAGRDPPSKDGLRSDRMQILHWRVNEPYSDSGTHSHQHSDEVYVVLEGSIDLEVDGAVTTVKEGRRRPSPPASHLPWSLFITRLGA